MPPKAVSRGRRSQQKVPEIIPIYDIIADKEQQDVVRQLSKKMQTLAKHDTQALQKSLFIFILKVCSLQGCIDKINWRQSIQSLSEILQQICEQNQKSIYINQLFLINEKSKFHKQFVKRIKNLLDVIFSDQLQLIQNTEVLKVVYEVLLTISKCKMRNIRHCSVVFSGLVIKSLIKHYRQLKTQKLNKKALRILNLIDERYLDQFIKPRLKDIDSQIRQKCFQIVGDTLISLQDQLLTSNRLHQYYTQTMADNKTKITQVALKSIIKIFEIQKEKMSPSAKKHLNTYANQVIKPLQELVLLPNRNSCYAMDALLTIHSFNPNLSSLKPRIIAKVFEIHGYQKFQEGLKKAVSVFFKSLINFNSKEQLNQHRSVLIIEITHLLCSINSSKLLSTILQQFFVVYTSLFTFDEIFLLLFTQYYHKDGSDVQLHDKQLSVLCTMAYEFNLYLRNNKGTTDRQKLELSYNKTVLTNCKQIFYEKIPKHSSLCHLYLRLFVLLFAPISGNITNYLSFVEQKTLNFIKQQQYISIIGTTSQSSQNLIIIQQIIHQCAGICQLLSRQSQKYQIISKNFGVDEMRRKDKLDDIDVIKAAALVSKFEIRTLIDQIFFKKILTSFNKSETKIMKLQSLSYMFHCHKYLFTSLFESPNLQKYADYTSIRSAFIDFIIHMVLNSSSEDTVIKLAAFNILCRTLRLVSNTKILDLSGVYFQLNQEQLQVIYDFIGEFVNFDEEQVTQTTMMIATMGLQTQQVRQQILQNIFLVFSECLKISLQKLSIIFITKLMLTSISILKPSLKYIDNFLTQLIKSQIAVQNNNKFIFWRLFSQIIQQIPIQDEEVMNKIILKLVDIYYKNKKLQNQTKSLLNNKLMLFIADYIDKCINSSKFQGLVIVKNLLSKTYRRFPKQILQRLLIFYTSKIVNNTDKNVKTMKDFLTKISKVGKKTKNKTNSDNDDNQSSSSQQSQNDKQQKQNKESNQQSDKEDQKQENIMVQKTPANQNKRNTRSKTKRKNM